MSHTDVTLRDDLDATLQVLTRLIGEIQETGLADASAQARIQDLVEAVRARPHLATLPGALFKVYTEVAAALTGIRITREAIQHHALDQLRDTQSRLSQVSNATESAAMEMLNGLDRTLGLLDGLETAGNAAHAATVATLREEVNQLFGHLQFQDIITQQLRGVMALLTDLEGRIATVADLLDQSLVGPIEARAQAPKGEGAVDYNPDAKWERGSARQAEVDAAFRN